MRRTLPAATCVAAVTLLAAGCGDSTAPPAGGGGGSSPAGAGAATSHQQPTPGEASSRPSSSTSSGDGKQTSAPERVRHRCHTSQLAPSIKVRTSSAGHRHAYIVLRNASSTTCTVYGFGGMQLYRNGDKVPTHLMRSTKQHQPRTNVVRPGDSVYSPIRWSTVPQGNEPTGSTCEPVATSARVTPPDEYDNKTVQWNYGPVCDHGRIVQGPYLSKHAATHHPV